VMREVGPVVVVDRGVIGDGDESVSDCMFGWLFFGEVKVFV